MGNCKKTLGIVLMLIGIGVLLSLMPWCVWTGLIGIALIAVAVVLLCHR